MKKVVLYLSTIVIALVVYIMLPCNIYAWDSYPDTPLGYDDYKYQFISIYGTGEAYLYISKYPIYFNIDGSNRTIKSEPTSLQKAFTKTSGQSNWNYWTEAGDFNIASSTITESNCDLYTNSSLTTIYFNQTLLPQVVIVNPTTTNYNIYPPIDFYSNDDSIDNVSMELYYNNEKYWSILCDVDGISAHINQVDIPYKGSGDYNIKIVDAFGTTVYAECNFTLNIADESSNFVIIQGISNGADIYGKRDMIIRSSGYNDMTLNINNTIIRSYFDEGTVIIPENEIPYQIGTNYVQITDSNGNLILDIAFTLFNSVIDDPEHGGGGGTIPSDTQIITPERNAYESGFIGDIKYGFDTLFYYIKLPFQLIGNLLKSMTSYITTLTTEMNGVIGFVTELFSFLPTPVVQALSFLVLATTLFFILKMVRG